MKRKMMSLAAIVVVTAMAVLFSACGSSNGSQGIPSGEASSEAPSSEIVSSTPSPSSEEAVSSSADSQTLEDKYSSIDEFVKSPVMQDQLPTLKSSVEQMGMDMDISGEDNKLVYTFKYKKDVNVSADALNSALDSQVATYKNIAASLKTAVNVDSPVVVVRYLDSKGKEIASREFSDQ